VPSLGRSSTVHVVPRRSAEMALRAAHRAAELHRANAQSQYAGLIELELGGRCSHSQFEKASALSPRTPTPLQPGSGALSIHV